MKSVRCMDGRNGLWFNSRGCDQCVKEKESTGEEVRGQKNAGLKAVTLIATLNPVSQVLW